MRESTRPPDDAAEVAPGRPWRWWTPDTEAALLVLLLKAITLILAVVGIGVLFDQYDKWATLWNRWDATHYLNLAENGYVAKGDGRTSIVFYPLSPWLVRAVRFFCRNYFGAA